MQVDSESSGRYFILLFVPARSKRRLSETGIEALLDSHQCL
ncbi:hypothetical protein KIS4809_5270 [Bacillus sp. ZZV12-4809]|nr:hypothetical protein KIS4809_5270 [Bacillus sp. ZZV12-4809]